MIGTVCVVVFEQVIGKVSLVISGVSSLVGDREDQTDGTLTSFHNQQQFANS